MKPISRLEKFLAKIAGYDVKISPKSRKEYFLNEIAENKGAGLIVRASAVNPFTLDKTWQEIFDAMPCIVEYIDLSGNANRYAVLGCTNNGTGYYSVRLDDVGLVNEFSTSSPYGYPSNGETEVN